ncbi:hypothetical protein CKA32_006273 [Geitlerinema sp. FC II]|nr:hypothetical protein CKA32_006273 [Geitlerinema sp. FC II]
MGKRDRPVRSFGFCCKVEAEVESIGFVEVSVLSNGSRYGVAVEIKM